jgi:hypothetical protein
MATDCNSTLDNIILPEQSCQVVLGTFMRSRRAFLH